MKIAVEKDSHLAECLDMIISGQVSEDVLMFAIRYGGPPQTLGEFL